MNKLIRRPQSVNNGFTICVCQTSYNSLWLITLFCNLVPLLLQSLLLSGDHFMLVLKEDLFKNPNCFAMKNVISHVRVYICCPRFNNHYKDWKRLMSDHFSSLQRVHTLLVSLIFIASSIIEHTFTDYTKQHLHISNHQKDKEIE